MPLVSVNKSTMLKQESEMIVKFNDSTYGIRRKLQHTEYEFLDLKASITGREYWWHQRDHLFNQDDTCRSKNLIEVKNTLLNKPYLAYEKLTNARIEAAVACGVGCIVEDVDLETAEFKLSGKHYE